MVRERFRRLATIALVGLAAGAASAASAQAGGWLSLKVTNPKGGMLCMLVRGSEDPHPFSLLFTATGNGASLTLEDRTEGLPFDPTMSVRVDGRPAGTFAVFNDPPISMTQQADTIVIQALLDQLDTASQLSIGVHGLTYTLDMSGFPEALRTWEACRETAGE